MTRPTRQNRSAPEVIRAFLQQLRTTPDSLIHRPPELVANLPAKYRWEFTRRHPYYLVAWEEVRQQQRGDAAAFPAEALTGFVGQAALLAIGVSGEPVDPSLEFDDPAFGGNDPLVISGACQPVTLRALAILLMQSLPPVDRAALGTIFFSSGGRDPQDPARQPDQTEDEALRDRGQRLLRTLPSSALNSYPLWPLFHLHLGSSQRTILEDVTTQLQIRQRGRPLARATRPDILDAYLDVWDQREGWTGSGYSRRATQRFVEIAGTRGGRNRLSTAFDRYRRAYELIIGQSYSTEIWWRLFGFLKFNRYLQDRHDAAERGVTPQSRRRRPPVPAPEEVFPQVQAWLQEGLADEEIAFRLGVESPVIAELREELLDRQSLIST